MIHHYDDGYVHRTTETLPEEDGMDTEGLGFWESLGVLIGVVLVLLTCLGALALWLG